MTKNDTINDINSNNNYNNNNNNNNTTKSSTTTSDEKIVNVPDETFHCSCGKCGSRKTRYGNYWAFLREITPTETEPVMTEVTPES